MEKQKQIESEIMEKLADPIRQIVEVIQDSSIGKVTSSVTTSVTSSILGSLPDIEALNKKTSYEIESIRQELSSLNNTVQTIENSNKILSDQFYEEKVIQPMVRGLFPVIDMIEDIRNKCQEDSIDSSENHDRLTGLQIQLETFISHYGIYPIRHKIGDSFDAKVMKPLKTVPTDKRKQDGKVALSLQSGFKKESRIVRLESVSLFKFQGA